MEDLKYNTEQLNIDESFDQMYEQLKNEHAEQWEKDERVESNQFNNSGKIRNKMSHLTPNKKKMKELLVEFKTAKLAKEKGFSQEIRPTYWQNGELTNTTNGDVRHLYCSSPTQALLQLWLREKHNINLFVLPNRYDGKQWYYAIGDDNNYVKIHPENSELKFEQALELGLLEALKLVKNN